MHAIYSSLSAYFIKWAVIVFIQCEQRYIIERATKRLAYINKSPFSDYVIVFKVFAASLPSASPLFW